MDPGRVTGGMDPSTKAPAPTGRKYVKIVLTAVLGVGLLDLAMVVLGFLDAAAFRHWAAALALAVLGSLAWEGVVRSTSGGRVRPLAWVAFPAAMLLGILIIPFLVLSAWPSLEGWFFRVNVTLDEATGTMAIEFPLAMEPGGSSLRFGEAALPPGYEASHPQAFQWTGANRLEVDVRTVFADLRLPRAPATLGINTAPGAPRFRYASLDEVPEQTVPIKARSR